MMTDLKEIEEEYGLTDDMEYIFVDMDERTIFYNKPIPMEPLNKMHLHFHTIKEESN